jgi:hypothetical protein
MQDEMVLLCALDGSRNTSDGVGGALKCKMVLRGFHGKVCDLAIDSSGRYLACAGSPGLIMWDFGPNQKHLKRNRLEDKIGIGPTTAVVKVAFHPRLTYVAGCTRDGNVLVSSI